MGKLRQTLARYLLLPIAGGSQTVGAGGGKATRQFSSNLYRIIKKDDFERGPVYVTDHIKVDAELNQIFNSVAFADPRIVRSNPNGNFAGSALVGAFITPLTTGTTAIINHGLGRIPVGWISVGPAVGSGQNVTWAQAQTPDTNNLYLKLVHPEDTNIITALMVW